MDITHVMMLLALTGMLVCVIGMIRNWNRSNPATKTGNTQPQLLPLGEALLGLAAVLALALFRLRNEPQMAALWWLWGIPVLFGVVGLILVGKKSLRGLYLKPPEETPAPKRQRYDPRNVQ